MGQYLASAYGNTEKMAAGTRRIGFTQAESVGRTSPEMLFEEMRENDVVCGVIPARLAAKGIVSNEETASIVSILPIFRAPSKCWIDSWSTVRSPA